MEISVFIDKATQITAQNITQTFAICTPERDCLHWF